MSASPTPFTRAKKSKKPVIQAPTSFTRVTEPDQSVIQIPIEEKISGAKLDHLSYTTPLASGKRWSLYFFSWISISLLAGVIAGRLLYLLWAHVASHDQQLVSHQNAIQGLTKAQTAVSGQANHIRALDTSVDAIQGLLNAQSRRLSDLEKGQAGVRDQVSGINARWQKQMNQLLQDRAPMGAVLVPRAENAVPAKNLPAQPVQPTLDKHNETFSPNLKPTPTSYAQMSPNGLVVWMTPRPGFPKPIPTSVIGYVRGLGMLVHDWEDNQHYFITDSGSWLADHR